MRNLLYALAAVMVIAVMAGCGKKATYLKSDVETFTLAKAGGQDSVVLHSDGSDFKVIGAPDWVDATLNDSVLLVKVGANGTGARRDGNIVVANGEQRLSLSVEQMSDATYLTAARKSVTIGQKGEPDTLSISTDGAAPRIEGVDGLTVKYSGGVLTIGGKGNEGATRTTKAKLICDTLSVDLTVVEQGTFCARCKGTGKIICTICRGTGVDYCPYRTCDWCHGRLKETCPSCKGKGK